MSGDPSPPSSGVPEPTSDAAASQQERPGDDSKPASDATRGLVRKVLVASLLGGAAFVDLHARPADVLATSFRQVIGEPPVYYLWDRDNEFPRRPSSRGIDDPRHRPQAQQGESDYE
ncbi:MAG: hypothetical protein HUU22_14540 [Phycisphaerae bacterium]|nr:hypothetical protein [Phycisphaerae bacterium]